MPVQSSRGLRLLDISRQSAHKDSKVVCHIHLPPLPLGDVPGTHVSYRLGRAQAILRPEGLSQ